MADMVQVGEVLISRWSGACCGLRVSKSAKRMLVMNWNCNCGVFFLLGFFLTTLFSSRKFFLVWCGFLPWVRLATCPKTAVASISFCISFCVWPTPFWAGLFIINFCMMYVVVVWLCCGLDVSFCTCLCCCQYPIILCWEHVCHSMRCTVCKGHKLRAYSLI